MKDNSSSTTLVDRLRGEFATLEAGSRVPTMRDVASRHHVSVFMVQRAFDVLKEEGLIQSFVGRGSFVTGGDIARSSIHGRARAARILIVSHSTPSLRGYKVAHSLQTELLQAGCRAITVSYSDAIELGDVLGDGRYDVCVLQPRRSILPVEVVAMLKSKARHMIVEGRELERLDVDVFVRNRAKSMALALNSLRELGHARIGLLTERLDAAAGYAAIENHFLQNHASLPGDAESLIVRASADQEGRLLASEIRDALQTDLANVSELPTGFIVSGRFEPASIKEGFRSAGFEIPADVSVVSLRVDTESYPEDARFTAVGRTTEHVVRGLVSMINWRLSNPNEPPVQVLDNPSLVAGCSAVRNDGTGGTRRAEGDAR
ncbi:MAG: substrate-binding domain-containing protein [Boseongicola sp.]|nr:substrate-binding domain-containing protein [Boseongicola sp.]MDE0345639.1 substrate-binding domain-containing protein [Boseongicola sp.]